MLIPTIFLSNKDGLSLEELMEILSQEHNEETVIELMRKYCLQSTSIDIQKKGMEFLYMNGFYNDLKLLIEKNNKSKNISNRQWSAVYQIMIDRRLQRYSAHETLQKVVRITTDEPDLKYLIEFVKVTSYYDMNQFSKIGNFLAIQQQLFEAIEDRLLVSYFKLRLNQILLTYYLIRNELIMARKYAYRVLNQSQNASTKASIHVKLGLSYTFDTYFQGMYHLSEALKIAKKHNLKNAIHLIEQRNIPFLAAHFNKVDNITTNDISEQAHIEIAKGNNDKAIDILSQIPLDSPFKIYYMGKAKQDKNLLLQSYNNFIEKRSDYFFSRLPLKVLKDMNA